LHPKAYLLRPMKLLTIKPLAPHKPPNRVQNNFYLVYNGGFFTHNGRPLLILMKKQNEKTFGKK